MNPNKDIIQYPQIPIPNMKESRIKEDLELILERLQNIIKESQSIPLPFFIPYNIGVLHQKITQMKEDLNQ